MARRLAMVVSERDSGLAELDNQRARARLFELIDGARSSIHAQVYIIRPSAFAEELIVKLIRRAPHFRGQR